MSKPRCPHCGSKDTYSRHDPPRANGEWKCNKCGQTWMTTIERPFSTLLECVIEPEIEALVRALNSDATVTTSSCSGHGEGFAHVSFYIEDAFVRKFTEILDTVHRATRRSCCMDLAVIWCCEITGVPSGDGDLPGWLLVSLTISRHREQAPSVKLLQKLATEFKKRLPGSGRPLRGPKRTADGWVDVDLKG